MKRKLLIGSLPFLAIAVACSGNKESQSTTVEQPAVTVKTATLQTVEQIRTMDYSTNFIAFKENNLTSASPGRIEKIFVEVGSHVKAGSVLVKMDQTQLRQAEIQLKTLEADFGRLEVLQKNGAVAQQQYDQLKSQLDQARTNVQFLKENTSLIAPYSGVITGKYFEDGEMYSGAPNTQAGKAAIVTLMQLNPVKAEIFVTEADFSKIKTGMVVDVAADAYPSEIFKGTIYRIYPSLDPASRSAKVELTIANADERLRPGMSGKAMIQMGVQMANVVPVNAVMKQQGANQRFVFVNENSVARRVNVEVGKRFDDKIEVISAELNSNSSIIVTGQSGLDDGDKITVVQ